MSGKAMSELEGENSEFGQEEGYVRSGCTPKLHV